MTKNIKLNSASFKKRSTLSQKSKFSYSELVKKNKLYKKIETYSLSIDSNSYLHIQSR